MVLPALSAAHLHNGVTQPLQGGCKGMRITLGGGAVEALHYHGVPWLAGGSNGHFVLTGREGMEKHGLVANKGTIEPKVSWELLLQQSFTKEASRLRLRMPSPSLWSEWSPLARNQTSAMPLRLLCEQLQNHGNE